MDARTLRATLSGLPHLRALPPDLIERIAANSRVVSLEAGEALFREGEPVRGFFAVVSGSVRVHRITPDGREQVLHHLHAGQSFAEAALLTMGRYPAHARAVSAAQVIEIGGATFLQLFRDDPRLAAAMVGSLCMWLLKLTERVEELTIASAPARLAHYLLRLPSKDEHGIVVVQLPMAKKDLAAHLAIAPETLSRLLRRWQDSGVVESRTKSIAIREPRVLIAIADSDSDAGD